MYVSENKKKQNKTNVYTGRLKASCTPQDAIKLHTYIWGENAILNIFVNYIILLILLYWDKTELPK